MPISTPEERLGRVIDGRYRLLRILGRGGMGVVFAGTHEATGRDIAIKVLLPQFAENQQILARFFQEAKAAAALNHPNVVDVLDVGRDDEGQAYIVLEMLTGKSLGDRLLDKGRLTPAEALEIALPVMDALAVAHEQGIVHRDIKPDNIFLGLDARGRMRPKLLDFGIAKLAEDVGGVGTKTGNVLGTPQYMAPEQAGADGPVTGQSDVWAVGVVLFECLTGQLPFRSESIPRLMLEIATTDARPIEAVAPELPEALAIAINRALRRDPNERFVSMDAFIEAVAPIAGAIGAKVDAAHRAGPRGSLMPGFDDHNRASEAPTMEAAPRTGAAGPSRTLLGMAVAACLLAVGAAGWALSRQATDPGVAAESTTMAAQAERPRPEPETTPEPPPPEYAPPVEAAHVVLVDTEPSGATVRVAGEEVGRAPVEVTVPPGEQVELEAQLPGYRVLRRRIGADVASPVSLTLTRRPRRPRGPSAPTLAPR